MDELLKFAFSDKLWRREVKENEHFCLAKSLSGTLLCRNFMSSTNYLSGKGLNRSKWFFGRNHSAIDYLNLWTPGSSGQKPVLLQLYKHLTETGYVRLCLFRKHAISRSSCMQLCPGRPEENPYRHGWTYLIMYLAYRRVQKGA